MHYCVSVLLLVWSDSGVSNDGTLPSCATLLVYSTTCKAQTFCAEPGLSFAKVEEKRQPIFTIPEGISHEPVGKVEGVAEEANRHKPYPRRHWPQGCRA
jgi:hypothetical protein